MEHSALMECGNYFALCDNCHHITVFEFAKCHSCRRYIDRKNYEQRLNIEQYGILVKALMNFEIDVLEDCHSMVSISIKGDKSTAPELHQIWKQNNKYTYVYFERDTHNKLKEFVIDDPTLFSHDLEANKIYQVELVYGPNVIYVHQ